MSEYHGQTLEQLNAKTDDYIIRHLDNGGCSEFDKSINDISRATIDAILRNYEQCFLGKINLKEEDRNNLIYRFTPYIGQKIYNFQYQFVVPCEDEELRSLIVQYNTPDKILDSKNKYRGLDRIYERIKEIGGVILFWS